MRRWLTLCVAAFAFACALAGGLGPAAGVASADWGAAMALNFPAGVASPQFALGSGGRETLGWIAQDATTGAASLEVVTRASAGDPWGPSAALALPNAAAGFQISGSGAAAAVWTTSGGAVMAAVLAPNAAWTTPATLAAAGSQPQIGVGADGEAVAAWLASSATTEIDTSAYEPDSKGTWAWRSSGVAGSSSDPPGTHGFTLAVGDGGDAALTFDYPDGSTGTANCAAAGGEVGDYTYPNEVFAYVSRPSGGTWTSPQGLRTDGAGDGATALRVSASGAVAMLWSYSIPDSYNCLINGAQVLASYGMVGTALSTASLSGGSNLYPAPGTAAIDADGNAIVTWQENSAQMDSYHPAGGSWGAAESLGSLTQMPANLSIAGGEAAAVVQQTDSSSGTTSVQAIVRPAMGGWSSPHTLSASGAQGTLLAGSEDGYLLAAWQDPSSGAWQGSLDVPAPAAPSITQAPPAQTNQRSATFAFATSTPGGTFECQLDGGSFSRCGSPATFSSLADGPHSFGVHVVAPDGTVGPTATRTWTVDTKPPVTTITSRSDATGGAWTATTVATGAAFTFSSSKAGSTFTCTLDGSSAPCDGSATYQGLAIGSHTFTVVATDQLGNVDPAGASATWTITTGGSCPLGPRGRAALRSAAGGSGAACTMTSVPPCTNAPFNPFNPGTACEPQPPDCPQHTLGQVAKGPFVIIAASVAGCFKPLRNGGDVSRGPVEINGLPFSFPGGSELVVDPTAGAIYATGGAVMDLGRWGRIPVPLAWGLPVGASKLKVSLEHPKLDELAKLTKNRSARKLAVMVLRRLRNTLKRLAKATKLAGLPVSISPELEFEHGAGDFDAGHGGSTRIGVQVGLPPVLKSPKRTKGFELSVQADAIFSNGNGTQFQLAGKVKEADFGGIALHDLELALDSTNQTVAGQATVVLPSAPPSRRGLELTVGMSFRHDQVVGFKVIAQHIDKPIHALACLTEVGFEKGINTNLTETGRAVNDTFQLTGGIAFGLPVAVGCDKEPIQVEGRLTLGTLQGYPLDWTYLQAEVKGSIYGYTIGRMALQYKFDTGQFTFNGDIDLNLGVLHGLVQIPVGGGKITKHGFDIVATADLTPSFPVRFLPIARALERHAIAHIDRHGIVVCNDHYQGRRKLRGRGHDGISIPWNGGIGAIRYYRSGCNLNALG